MGITREVIRRHVYRRDALGNVYARRRDSQDYVVVTPQWLSVEAQEINSAMAERGERAITLDSFGLAHIISRILSTQ